MFVVFIAILDNTGPLKYSYSRIKRMSLNWAVRAFAVVFLGVFAITAQAQEESRKARELLTDAVEYYKEHGDIALAAISRQGEFVRDDLYVFVVNTNGIMLASGGPSVMLIGRDIFNTIDDELKPRFQQALDLPPGAEIYESDYPWGHWNSRARKLTKYVYFQRVDDKIFAVGHYQPRANSDEALELLNVAVEAVEKDARATFNAINALDERFYKDDLYVFVIENDSQRIVAHGSSLRLVGRNLGALANQAGRPIKSDDLVQVNKQGAIEFEYQWEHPITGEIENKHAFARKVGNYLVAVGYYRPSDEEQAD